VIETATALRARYRFLKTPDAIHLASASLTACDVFLTHDRALERCAELRVEVMAG
jgi:predicted nucleic acid-binding protein